MIAEEDFDRVARCDCGGRLVIPRIEEPHKFYCLECGKIFDLDS